MIKIVLCDMDGTLLPFGRRQVSERAMAAIRELRSAGIEFGVATGREPVDLRSFFHDDESCYRTGVMANGKIVDVEGERVLERPLDHGALVRLAEFASTDPSYALITYVQDADERGRACTRVMVNGSTRDEVLAFYRRAGLSLAETGPCEVGPVADGKIMTAAFACLDEHPDMGRLRERLGEAVPEFDYVLPAPTVLDVLPRGWTKADALRVLEERLGIGPEEVAFFGDSENDIAMMDAVPVSFVVSSGSHVAQTAARYRIGDAADDSVAKVMEAIARSGGEVAIPEDAMPR